MPQTHRTQRDQQIRLITEFFAFGFKNALSCLFPVFIFSALAITKFVPTPFIARYDLLLLLCLGMQYFMYKAKLETKDEIKVICLFHFLGLMLELYKVNTGRWAYPTDAYTKIFGVPLYSGFMYASVASFICQGWRWFQIKLLNWPKFIFILPLAIGIYGNFFTRHFVADIRWFLITYMFLLFARTSVQFTNLSIPRTMPLPLAFFLIGVFLWIAENIATYLGAWTYPYQTAGWQLVGFDKLSSWFLLVIVSFIIVAELKRVKGSSN